MAWAGHVRKNRFSDATWTEAIAAIHVLIREHFHSSSWRTIPSWWTCGSKRVQP